MISRSTFGATAALLLALLPMSLGTGLAQERKKDAANSPPSKAASSQVPAEPATTQATYGDWTLMCQRTEVKSAPKICEVAHSVVVRGQQQGPIMQVALSPLNASERSITVVLPNNITLPDGPKVGLGESDPKPLSLAYSRCLPVGCFAVAKIDADIITAWRNTTQQGVVTFVDGSQRTLNVPFSLRGLPQALDALAKE